MSISRFGYELFRRYPTLFAGNVVLALLLMMVDAATLASIAPIVSLLTQEGGGDTLSPYIMSAMAFLGLDGGIVVYLSVFVVLTILNSVLLIAINYFLLRAQFVVRADMVVGTAERVLSSSVTFLAGQRQGDFINTLTIEVARVADAFTALTRMIAPAAQVIVLLWIPFFVSWQVTAIAMAVAAVLLVPLRTFRARVYGLGQVNTKANNEFSTALQESLQNARLIIGFGNIRPAIERLRHAFAALRSASIGLQFIQSTIYSLHAPIGIVVVFATFLSGQRLGVPLAEIAVVLYAFNRLAGTVANINQNRSQLISLYPSFEQVMKVRRQAEESTVHFGSKPFDRLTDAIVLDNVSFSYNSAVPVLDAINLEIPSGKMTALVGASGAGKSTLADIVMGLLHPSAGTVGIDGVPMREVDISAYRGRLGYVPQRTSLFHASVRDNIAFANPGASDEEIREACRLANAEEFVADLENGYDTIVGDQGFRLSGGQAQRISLARALVRKPTLLILDEATSALDTKSEQLIQSAIETIVGTTTFLVIAHRLSTIKRADNIAVMERGRIVEQGTFDQLMRRDGAFARLVEMQQL
ncbi:MAG: hypothetical protein COW30_15065 [Rhodospirillales bacterium CG15_BIG_FIL_POST_REV_8_21_14_020_66_15]|nr:MAG: hypothetical protein COW30_15065 [Rhodospirillales bacterium CG15_BIG_FIL_POST_REV_8_21_14_020_66_15]